MKDSSPLTMHTKRPAVWFYHIFNLNSLVIFSFIVFVLLTEIQFDFIEKMAGNFLKWHNQERQKLGRMWNLEQQSVEARGQLSELLIKKEEKQKQLGNIESFRELLNILKTDRLLSLTKEQFTKIYNRLPSNIASKIIDPYDLVNYFYRSNWIKTFIFRKNTGIEIVMVDAHYGVLNSILISGKDSSYLANFEKTISTSLENIEELNNRIYDVREFMDALYEMSYEERSKIIYSPFNILRWQNRLKRIGISEISEDNLVQIGFELHTLDKKEVVIVYLDDFLISSLIQNLTGEKKSLTDDIEE